MAYKKIKNLSGLAISLLMLTAFLVGCSPEASKEKSGSKQSHASAKKSETTYTCSMHPQIRQNKPGNCPICGMTLVPAKAAEETETAVAPGTVHLMPAQNAVASIVTESAKKELIHQDLQFFGEIAYIQDQHKDFTWFYSGRVQRLLINYNTTEVKAGTPLIELYSEAAIMDQERYLQALRDRYLTTFYERSVATAQIETVKARLLQGGFSEQNLDDLVNLKKVKTTLVLRAPLSGTLFGDFPQVGDSFAPDKMMFHIVNLDRVWFVAKVFEQDMDVLHMGQKIKIETKARPGRTYDGTLVFIDRTVDPSTRTVRARYVIDNPNHELLPALSAAGHLITAKEKTTITVPTAAIIDTGKRKIVYVRTTPDTYALREVQPGSTGKGVEHDEGMRTEILSGLNEGDDVVVSGAFLIDAEAQLRNSVAP